MSINLVVQDLIPVRRDGQVSSVSIGGGGRGIGTQTYVYTGNTFDQIFAKQLFLSGNPSTTIETIESLNNGYFALYEDPNDYSSGARSFLRPGSLLLASSNLANANQNAISTQGFELYKGSTEFSLYRDLSTLVGTINPWTGPGFEMRLSGGTRTNLIGFQDESTWTDGTVTMLTPVNFNSGLTIQHGTIVLEDTVWDDLRVVPTAFDFVGGTDPTLVDWMPGGTGGTTKGYEFAKNDVGYFTTQLPHNYKVGTDIYVHVHWTPHSYGSTQSGNTVGWKVQYSITSINGTFPSMQTADLSDACDGTNYKHQMTPDVLISGSTFGISSMIVAQITRTDTGADDTWSQTLSTRLPILLGIDFHYQIDTLGSRERASK